MPLVFFFIYYKKSHNIIQIVYLYKTGSLINSPCKKTSGWSKYHIRCRASQTVYITSHVIEDGFNTHLSPALGCSANDAVYCGAKLPTNNTMNLKKHDLFESAVNECNGRTECTLGKHYFLKAESSVKMSCDALRIPELEKASFRQSVYYECIQGIHFYEQHILH